MTHLSRTQLLSLPRCGLMIFVLALAGCDREKIKVQQVPKESEQSVQPPPMQPAEASTMPANPHAGMGMDMGSAPAQPQLKWTLPSGWRTKDFRKCAGGGFTRRARTGRARV